MILALVFLAAKPSQWVDSFLRKLPVGFHRPYLHFTAICLLLVLIVLFFLISRLRGLFDQLHRKWNPPAPYQPQLLVYYRNAVLWWVFLLLITGIFMAAAFYLSHYQYIGSGVEPAGIAIHHGDSVRFTAYDGSEHVYESGPGQVAACGIFFRFPSWMEFLGLRTYHRMIAFRNMSQNKYHYMRPEPEFIRSYADPIYSYLYKHQWLDAHYTESVYFPPGKHEVLVTHSGYIVR